MSRKLIALAAVAALAALPATAEMTLEDVLKLHHESIGGVDAWSSWETARMTGTMQAGGGQMEAPFTMVFSNTDPGMSRLEFTFQGMTGIQAYDGEQAWAIMPFMGKTDAEPMPADQAKMMKENSDFAGPLINSADKNVEIEYQGTEEVEGTDAHKLKVTLENGDVRHYYLDTDYGLPFRVEAKTMMQGQEVDVETSLGDYKEVGGMVFPHVMESKPKGAPAGQVITIENVEFGVELPDDYFTMPEPAPAPAAADGGS